MPMRAEVDLKLPYGSDYCISKGLTVARKHKASLTPVTLLVASLELQKAIKVSGISSSDMMK
jgi:hypothetical protein